MNKYINIIIINFVFLIILYYLIELYYFRFHKFWGIQPISKYNLIKFNDGIITLNSPPKILESNKVFVNTVNTIDDIDLIKIKDFLNLNYSDNQIWNYNYDEIYLNHQFNLYNKDKINLILKDSSSQIIGFISARPHTIFLKDRKLLTLYADNLCVSQSYRHNNLAAILISNLTNEAYKIGYNVIIFRKDSIPLPFKFITYFKNKIYYLPTGKINNNILVKGTRENFNLLYNFFMFEIKKNNSYIYYSPLEFNHYFFNDYVDIWYQNDNNNNLCNLIVAFNNHALVNNSKIIDLPYMFINNKELSFQFFNSVLFYYSKKNFTYCNINNFGESYYFLERNLDIYKSYSTYIQMYNYHTLYPINKSNLYFL